MNSPHAVQIGIWAQTNCDIIMIIMIFLKIDCCNNNRAGWNTKKNNIHHHLINL